MEDFKEFQGKSLDEAIRAACSYFDAPREKLEIDIVQDAKNGIFGLVGARKALVRARRAPTRSRVGAALGRNNAPQQPEQEAPRPKKAPRERQQPLPDDIGNRIEPEELPDDAIGNRILPEEELDDSIGNRIESAPRPRRAPRSADWQETRPRYNKPERAPRAPRQDRFNRDESYRQEAPDRETAAPQEERSPREERFSRAPRPERSAPEGASERTERPRGERTERFERRPRFERTPRPGQEERRPYTPRPRFEPVQPAGVPEDMHEMDEALTEGLTATPFADLDKDKLLAAATEAASRIVSSILGETPVEVTILENRVDIRVDCGDDSGLLIGREGQTLAALQYITSRIVSRTMEAPVRIQYNVGDYRERQDDRLREIALNLADRVRATGRPCSTRPMSSYHRRLVHMALQDDPDVQTRSSGEGPLKRVIIQRRRPERGSSNRQ